VHLEEELRVLLDQHARFVGQQHRAGDRHITAEATAIAHAFRVRAHGRDDVMEHGAIARLEVDSAHPHVVTDRVVGHRHLIRNE
jgi:hypothetical protein